MSAGPILIAPLLAVSVCGSDPPTTPDAPPLPVIDALPDDVIMEDRLLAPGEVVETIIEGGPGDYAGLALTAPFPALSWNIHGHAGGGTQNVYEEFKVSSATYVFQPTSEARWYLLTRNDGQTSMTINVRLELYGFVRSQ